MEITLQISKETFMEIKNAFEGFEGTDYYTLRGRKKHCPFSAGYYLSDNFVAYNTCRGNRHGAFHNTPTFSGKGMYSDDTTHTKVGHYYAFFEGARSRVSDLLHLLGEGALRLKIVDYKTTEPDWFWWEEKSDYLVRQGKKSLLQTLPKYEGDYKTESLHNAFDQLDRSTQRAIKRLYGCQWADAIMDGGA